jgi:hypothetical protein
MANDFSGDSSCVALYNFESGAIVTDSKGSNTLTLSATPPSAYTADKKQGGASCLMVQANDTSGYITDANQGTGFPGKSDDTKKRGTFAFWVKFNSITSGKWNGITLRENNFAFSVDTDGKFHFHYRFLFYGMDWGWGDVALDLTPTTDVWYHVVIKLSAGNDNSSNNLCLIHIYDESTELTKSFIWEPYAGPWSCGSGEPFYPLGRNTSDPWYPFDGLMDEYVVFNRCLSITESIAIRKGTFGTALLTPNDFSDDSDCVSVWNFLYATPLADSKGTNTIVPYSGSPVPHYMPAASGDEGMALWNGYSNAFPTIPDDNLSAGTPLKNGDTTKKLTFCSWKMLSQSTPTAYCFTKCDMSVLNNGLTVKYISGEIVIYWGDGDSYETINTGIYIPPANNWFHIAIVADGVAKTVYVRLYSPYDDTVYTYGGSATDELNANTYPMYLGIMEWGIQEYTDETVLFKRLLSATEIDAIRSGTFVFSAPSSTAIKTWCGLANANIKTINGLARANVKSIVGLA